MIIGARLFAQSIELFFPKGLPRRVAVALSGGVDSMALTHLLATHVESSCSVPNRPRILAITVDHQLRPESADEAAAVGAYVKQRYGGVLQHAVGTLKWPRTIPGDKDFEHVARRLRYDCIGDICRKNQITAVFVAHTLDDQIETFLLRDQKVPRTVPESSEHRLNRVFGMYGISAKSVMPFSADAPSLVPVNEQIHVFRPLLLFRKQQLIDTCVDARVTWFQDPTNEDPGLTERNRVRSELLASDSQAVLARMLDIQKQVKVYRRHMAELEAYLVLNRWLVVAPELLAVALRLPVDVFRRTPAPVLDRLIYEKCALVSASLQYYYKYLRISGLYTIIEQLIALPSQNTSSMVALNMVFRIELSPNRNYIHINIARQNLSRGRVIQCDVRVTLPKSCKRSSETVLHAIKRREVTGIGDKVAVKQSFRTDNNNVAVSNLAEQHMEKNTHEWTPWVVYDNRYWFKFRAKPHSPTSHILRLRHYNPKHYPLVKKEQEIEKHPLFIRNLVKHYSVPVLEDASNGEILGFPPVYIPDFLDCKWATKPPMETHNVHNNLYNESNSSMINSKHD